MLGLAMIARVAEPDGASLSHGRQGQATATTSATSTPTA
jgi:hypothetical protein